MELLPPVGWADVATKQDLGVLDSHMGALETRMGSLENKVDDIARELRAQTWKLMTLVVAVVGTVVAAVRL
jgi:hypothetical protein